LRSEEEIRKKIEILTKHWIETKMSDNQKQFTDGVISGLRWVLADKGHSG